ncbi:MAG TPA: M1 family aminopeptidase [Casimicrobiaceae bacterium]
MRRVAWIAALAVHALAGPVAVSAQTPVDRGAEVPALRVPEGARPTRYALTMTVVPGEAKASGEIAIDVRLDRAHPVLWLNAVSLSISRASVDAAETRTTLLPGNDQFVGLAFDPPLPAGAHRLTLAFDAEQNRNSTRGIFTLEDGGDWYTMTQFEATAARQAFPCFDEPGFKVPWQLTLRVPRGATAVSNTPVASETIAGDGMKVVRFAPTEPLPSYLIAFAVGPWDVVDLGRAGSRATPLRLIAPRAHAAQLGFAAHAFPQLFGHEERWFGLPYPFAKLDQIAIPLTVRFAMENAGLITYGAPILLEPGAATPPFRHAAANVGAHEMAHQWFGNLVTMAWWDDLWLNEAFATWFAEKMVDAWQPAYERGGQRVHARADAIEADSLAAARRIREPIASRGDIFNAFDAITYQKGATVIGMFERWIGEVPFRAGVRSYLGQHRYGSATVDDFLGALSAAIGRAVAPAFATFLDQNGVPQVGVELDCSEQGARLRLSQGRHAPLGEPSGAQRWQVPVCVRYGSAASTRNACTLLTGAAGTLELQNACPAFVFANAGGSGYYVPDYRGPLLARLKAQRNVLTPAEYASLLYDLRPLVRAGSVDAGEALDWVRLGARSADRHVLVAAIELAAFVRDKLVADDGRDRFASFIRRVFGPRARALGFAPRRGESDDDQLLRRTLLRFAAPEHPRLAAQARRLARAWIADRNAVDRGLADAVLIVAARTGDAALFEAMLREARATSDRLDRRKLMVALFSFGDPVLARRGLELLLDPGVDIREAMTALSLTRDQSPPSREGHDFIVAHFDALAARVDRDAPGAWPAYAASLCSDDERRTVEAFWRPRAAHYPGAERNLAQALEAIELCSRLRAREGPRVGAYLASH